jgi:hypothetical protein
MVISHANYLAEKKQRGKQQAFPVAVVAQYKLNFFANLSIISYKRMKGGKQMIHKRTILKKILSRGELVEFMLVRGPEEFQAALQVNGSHIPGPPLPLPLDHPKDEITHWMGNRKICVGLTANEAELIIAAVEVENNSLQYREQLCG